MLDLLDFPVAGVTFKNEDGSSRQAILRRIEKGQIKDFDTDFELYNYEGSPAIHVLCDGMCVGNVPKKYISSVEQIWDEIVIASLEVESFEDDYGKTIYRADVHVAYGERDQKSKAESSRDEAPIAETPTKVECQPKPEGNGEYANTETTYCDTNNSRNTYTGFSVLADSWPIPISACFAGAVLMQLSRGTWMGVILTALLTALFTVLAVVVRIVRRKRAGTFVPVPFQLRAWYALFLVPLACLILFVGDMLEPKSTLPPAGTAAPSTATTYAPAAPSDNDRSSDGMTTGQRNALGAAVSYLDAMPFSRTGLIHQLEYEGYTTSDATFAADNCGADWNAQALASAKSYLQSSAFSFSGLKEQLEYEGFSDDEAYYGVTQCGADWNEQAVLCAASYLSSTSFSREELIRQLEYEGFSHDQAVYGAAQNGY